MESMPFFDCSMTFHMANYALKVVARISTIFIPFTLSAGQSAFTSRPSLVIMSPMKWCGAIIFAASQLSLVRGELVMVYSLQRNGARQIIAGNSTLAGAHYKGGPSLLPEGRKETYDAGHC